MRLITHNDIYYEFITKADRLHASTISDKAERDVYHKDHTITLKQVQKYVDYIIIQSSSRGLWRYVIGDVISFVDNDQTTAPTIRHQGRIGWHSNMFNEHMEAGHVIAAVDAAKVINPTLHSASFIS
ncbi:GH3 auxin-responsive promoter family protein [Patescibacteria group bacterium]|nr:GH3 auxin-responsive promoter family protein [Patescibacteria group bacterium]